MVLSTTKRTSMINSLTNQNQQGGSKKAGLLPSVRDIRATVYYNARGLPQSMEKMNTYDGKFVFPHRDVGFPGILRWR